MAKLKATPKTFEQAQAVLGNRHSVKLGNETWLESFADATGIDRICVRLFSTHIVTFLPSGEVTLRTGGHYKRTTKDRFNRFVDGRVFSNHGDWFYAPAYDFNNVVPFYDGMNVGAVPLVLVAEVAKPDKSDNVDFRVQNEGSIYIFYALTDAAKQWVADHISEEDYRPWGTYGFVVEHRYAADLALGITEDGLTIIY